MSLPRILAVRHGESVWNVLRTAHPSDEEQYLPIMHTPDCNITDTGIEQCREAGVKLEQDHGVADDFLLVVSPLRRALQTAQHMLKGNPKLKPKLPMTVHPAATEVLVDPCDIGTPLSKLQPEFPHDVDFELLECTEFWWPGGHSPEDTWKLLQSPDRNVNGGKESEEKTAARIGRLKEFLASCCHRKSSHADGLSSRTTTIVLVCHSETIWWLTRRGDGAGMWTKNGEIVDITEFVLPTPATT